MAYLLGEKFHCDSCGAEILYVKPCLCADKEPKAHSNMCCSKEMRSLGVQEDELVRLKSKTK